MNNPDVFALARELSDALERKGRANGVEFVKLKDGSPQWMTDVIRTVHGDKLPDDTVYAIVEQCADAIADSDDPQEAIYAIEPDCYTHNLTAWLNARVDHVYYLTEALEQTGAKDGFELLAQAQKLQIDEIGCALLTALEILAEERQAHFDTHDFADAASACAKCGQNGPECYQADCEA